MLMMAPSRTDAISASTLGVAPCRPLVGMGLSGVYVTSGGLNVGCKGLQADLRPLLTTKIGLTMVRQV